MPIKDEKTVILSYSAYADYLDCPYKYNLKKIERIKPEKENITFTVPGTIIHPLGEKFIKTGEFSTTKEDILNELIEYDSKVGVNIAEAYGSMDKALDFTYNSLMNLYKFLLGVRHNGNKFMSEVFFGSWENPVHLINNLYTLGAADLVVDNKNGTSILYDFKTTWVEKNLKIEQLLLYKLVYEKVYNKNIKMCSFFLLPSNRQVYYTFTKENEDRLLNRMDTAAKAILKRDFPKVESNKCLRCPYFKNICNSDFKDTPKKEIQYKKLDIPTVSL